MPPPDLRLAESYIPGAVLWFKGLLYAAAAPAVLFGGDLGPHYAFCFLLVLQLDHVYASWPGSFLDSTSVAGDVFGCTLLAVVLRFDHSACPWCALPAVVWLLLGVAHLHWRAFPRPLAHALSACCAAAAVLTTPLRPFPLAHQQGAAVALLAPFLVRALLYMLLVLADAYLLPQHIAHCSDRLNLVRYGSVLLSPWQLSVACGLVLMAGQAFLLSSHRRPCGASHEQGADAAEGGGSPRHAPPQQQPVGVMAMMKQPLLASSFHPPACTSSSSSSAAVDADVMEAFRIAKQQYNMASSVNKTC